MEHDQVIEDLLTVAADGRVVARVGLIATLYFEGASKRHVRAALLTCFDDFLALAGDEIRWALSAKGQRLVDWRRRRVHPREWLLDREEMHQTELLYFGADDQLDAPKWHFEVLGRASWEPKQTSYLHIAVPFTLLALRPGEFQRMLLRACEALRPAHGYGGAGIVESANYSVRDRNRDRAYALAKRFPGLEYDDPVAHVADLDRTRAGKPGFKSVNWLTVLDDRWLPALGGLDHLRVELEPECTIHRYSQGVMIQAGPVPQIGDVNRGLFPETYRKVYRAIRAVQVQGYPRGFFDGRGGPPGFDFEETQAWLTRFA